MRGSNTCTQASVSAQLGSDHAAWTPQITSRTCGSEKRTPLCRRLPLPGYVFPSKYTNFICNQIIKSDREEFGVRNPPVKNILYCVHTHTSTRLTLTAYIEAHGLSPNRLLNEHIDYLGLLIHIHLVPCKGSKGSFGI